MVHFTLKQIHYLQAVVQHGGLAQAARHINISQPAIAQAMDKLEDICGFKLFVRHHAKGFELTPKGHLVYREMHFVLQKALETNVAIEDIRNDVAGVLRVGCFQSIAPFYLANILQAFKRDYPQARLESREFLHDRLISSLKSKGIDLAIMYDLGEKTSDLKIHNLSSAKPYIILPKGHHLSGRKAISLKQLQNEKYVLFDAPGSREYFYDLFKKTGIKPEISFHSTSLESVRSAVGNGMGFSILSMRPATKKSYDGNNIMEIEVKEKIEPTPIILAHRIDMDLDVMHLKFIDYCRTIISRK